jgi:outer membrane protein assembly factor BamB
MRRVPPSRAWLSLSVFLFGSVPICMGAAQLSGFLSRDLLDRAGLAVVWETTLPLKSNESLDTMLVLEDRLYIRSNQNYVWSIQRDTNQIIFARAIAPTSSVVYGWTVYDDELIAVLDNQVVEFDKNTGLQERVSDLEVEIVAPPARNSQFFYVSGADRRLHAFRADDMVQIFEGAVVNESLMTSVIADEQEVVVGTDGGNVVAIMADAPRKLWQFDVNGAIAGPVVREGDAFYFASKDTMVYRIDHVDRTHVNLVWRYQSQAVLDRQPRVASDAVYQYALYQGLAAIDKQRGTALWFLPEGVDLLAEAGGRAYVICKDKTLAVMDNEACKRLYWVNFGPVKKYATNTIDGKIYVADDRGNVTCLQPVR